MPIETLLGVLKSTTYSILKKIGQKGRYLPIQCFEDPWTPGAGSDKLHAHIKFVRGTEKYNIFYFEENWTERHFPIALERCLCVFNDFCTFFYVNIGFE